MQESLPSPFFKDHQWPAPLLIASPQVHRYLEIDANVRSLLRHWGAPRLTKEADNSALTLPHWGNMLSLDAGTRTRHWAHRHAVSLPDDFMLRYSFVPWILNVWQCQVSVLYWSTIHNCCCVGWDEIISTGNSRDGRVSLCVLSKVRWLFVQEAVVTTFVRVAT